MSATAVADIVAGTIHAVVEIAAPPERVFRALCEPEELAAWWGSADTYRTFDWSIDLRPGGRWSASARTQTDENISTVRGEYRTVEPPRVLEYTWEASWEQFVPTLVRIEIEPTPVGARVTVIHSGFAAAAAREGHAEGWKRVLGWLVAHIQEVSP